MLEVEISPETTQTAKQRARLGGRLRDELARAVVEEAIFSFDPGLDLVIDYDAAVSSKDGLSSALGTNDVVVNGCRLDVRALDADGTVCLNRALALTAYMQVGTLVVELNGSTGGRLIAFVPAQQWALADSSCQQQTLVVQPSATLPPLPELFAKQPGACASKTKAAVDKQALAMLVACPTALPLAEQRALVESLMSSAESWAQFDDEIKQWSTGNMRSLLSAAGSWAGKVESLVELASRRFQRLSREELRALVAAVGEKFGGQPEAPGFRQALLQALTREELAATMHGALLKKAAGVAEAVLSGKAVSEAVKDVSQSDVAVRIAAEIKRQRNRFADFAEASAQELAFAFQQLALKPAYATHASDPASSIASINEALALLAAGEIAKQAQEFEDELAGVQV